MKYNSHIDASKAGKLIIPTYATFAGFPAASGHTGGFAYATDTNKVYYSNGSSWVDFSPVTGAMVFKGVVAFDATEPLTPATGDYYVFSTAGTNIWEGSTIVEIGDAAVWNGTAWQFIQGNTVAASTTAAGVVELATSAETITGTDTVRAVTPAGFKAGLDENRVTSVGGTAGAVLTGDTVATTFEVIHSAGPNALVSVRETVTGEYVTVDVVRTAPTTFDITFAIAPALTPTYTVIVR